MGKDSRKKGVEEILAAASMQTQTERLEVKPKGRRLTIGLPKESALREYRIALTPAAVRQIIQHGHQVIIESGAGLRSNYSDHQYAESGAEISKSKEQVFKSKVLLKVVPPSIDEADLLQPNQILISPLQMPIITQAYIEKLLEKRVTAVAMEYMQDDGGSYPIVRILSEMAGISAMMVAAELLSNINGGPGILLGGISGVPPAKVVILGAGVVAEFASRTALGMGAQLRIFDNNIYKLMRLQSVLGRHIYTSSLDPDVINHQLKNADAVIGAIHSKSGRAPMVITEDQVRLMQEGSVIIDVSIDQGGCIETSELTTHEHPTFVKHGVTHYCVPNIASRVSRTASMAISNILAPILIHAGDTIGIKSLLFNNLGLRHGVYTYKGCLTNVYLSRRFHINYTNLDLLITSGY